jgi:transcriptional regulator with GAF, ATPase, and Fis domain
VDERLRFEMLLADLSVGFGGLAPAQLDEAIGVAQRGICECLGLDRSGLWLTDPKNPAELRLTNLYQRPAEAPPGRGGPEERQTEVPPMPGADARSHFPWLLDRAKRGGLVVIRDLDDLPAEAAIDRRSLLAFGFRSMVLVPLEDDGALAGILSLVKSSTRLWEPSLLKRLELAGRLLTISLVRLRQEAELRRSEARVTLAVELAELGLYETVAGPDTAVFLDDRLRSILGTSDCEAGAVMEFWRSHLHPEDRERVLEEQRRLWAGEFDTTALEYRFLHPTRGIVWISHVGRAVVWDGQGRACRLIGVIQDITERKRGQQELEEQLRFETVLSALSAEFVNLPAAKIDAVILEAQRRICECLDVDLSALWQWSADSPASQSLTHLYRRKPGPPASHLMDASEYFPWCLAELTAGRTISLASIDEAPPDAARDVEVWHHFGVRSSLTIPLSTGGGPPLGSLNFATVAAERSWPEHLVQRIRLIATVFANALERKLAEERLRSSFAEVKRLQGQLEQENLYLQKEHQLLYGNGQFVGESRVISDVLAAVEQVAPQHTTVLIEGETGVGKELIARRIHELSPRGRKPMVKVNCSALPSTLVESELFGREKGAFTGSVARELGRFEIANGSTIFLDEVGELPLELQAKLLRVLEEGEFERVGSPRTLHTDARVIAATNRNLEEEVKAGRFRRDLYYRISAFPIRVPPLRERREDIPLLMWAIIEEFSAAMHKEVKAVPRRTVDALKLYDWPGNVRELRNVVERAMIRANGPTLVIDVPGAAIADREPSASLDEAQRRHIEKVIGAAGGRISGPGGAAELLGLKRTTLNSLMKRLGIERQPAAGRRQRQG